MKRFLRFLLVIAIVMTLLPVAAFAAKTTGSEPAINVSFTDTDKLNKSFLEAIDWAVSNDITTGYSNNTFRPNNTCTRGHVVTFLWRADGSPDPKSLKNPFKDVSQSSPYFKAILWAAEKGITTGYSDDTFRPDAACTRAHVVTFLWRYENKPAATGSVNLKDLKGLSADFTASIKWAASVGITTGYSDGTFRPNDICTRAHVVTFLYRDIQNRAGQGTTTGQTDPTESKTEREYEKLLKAIDGYYWYLDGYEYAYIRGDVIPWYDHECLSWESENIRITQNSLVAYENYEPAKYREYDSSASSDTHNTLLVNPVEYADSLIEDFGMRVSSNKLYMTVGGQQYSFTRHSQKKAIVPTLSANQTSFAVTEGEWVEVTVTASPWWQYYTFDATGSGAIQGESIGYGASDGKVSFSFYATKKGTGSAVIKEKNSGASITISVTVSPTYVERVSLDQTAVELTKGNTATLKAIVSPSNASNKNVTWSSSNTSVATVSSSGVVTAKSPGTAIITVTTNDGGHTASCGVTVKQSPLKVSASIGMEMRFTSVGMQQGVSVNIKASGGSESYVAYSIKLYYEGEYVGEVTEKSMFVTPYKNGTYTADVYVKDSAGNEATSTSTTYMSITVS